MNLLLRLGLIWLTLVPCAIAQNQTTNGEGEANTQPVHSCLTPEQHEEIKALLQAKLSLLRQSQKLDQNHPLFIFPLQKAKPSPALTPWYFINFVEHRPTVGPNDVNQYSTYNRDYNCGNRTYNRSNGSKHTGTDIGLYPFAWQMMANEEVKVVAAAPGIIFARREGNPDQNCGSFTSGGDWNGVYLYHADGSTTWYGHLKTGSVTTKPIGATVAAGEFLGYVGSSGGSSAPHFHFEVYDANNNLIDPFQGSCNSLNTNTWWQQQPNYAPKVLSRISIHQQLPVLFTCPSSANQPYEVNYGQPGQGLYFYAWGLISDPGEPIRFDLLQPNGTVQTSRTFTINNKYDLFYYFLYTSLPANAPSGTWQIQVTYAGTASRQPFTVLPYPVCESYDSGDWNQAARWSCGQVPASTSLVQINAGHAVSIGAGQGGLAGSLRNYGRLIVGPGGRIQLSP